jgi:hypothetical protein
MVGLKGFLNGLRKHLKKNHLIVEVVNRKENLE